jgi:hypothetical protein
MCMMRRQSLYERCGDAAIASGGIYMCVVQFLSECVACASWHRVGQGHTGVRPYVVLECLVHVALAGGQIP